jgi:hypothetical protein
MKAVINTLRKTSSITQDQLLVSREIFRFCNTKDGLWSGAKRYAY